MSWDVVRYENLKSFRRSKVWGLEDWRFVTWRRHSDRLRLGCSAALALQASRADIFKFNPFVIDSTVSSWNLKLHNCFNFQRFTEFAWLCDNVEETFLTRMSDQTLCPPGRQHGVRLVVCVDELAASGGYMMACCGHKILISPFAAVGSIGVILAVRSVFFLMWFFPCTFSESNLLCICIFGLEQTSRLSRLK